MNKIIHLNAQESTEIIMADIPTGTFFRMTKIVGNSETEYSKHLFLRTFNGMVNIDDPSLTWTDSFRVKIAGYRPVEVTIREERFIEK